MANFNTLYFDSDSSGLSVKPGLLRLQDKLYLTIGMTDSAADYICDAIDDHVQFQQAIDALSSQGGGTIVVKPGTYIFGDTVRINFSNVIIQGVDKNSVTIKPKTGFVGYTTSPNNNQRPGLFSFWDFNASDNPIENWAVKDITFDFAGINNVVGIFYRTPTGNVTTDRLFLDNITSDSFMGSIPAGYDFLYGFVENITTTPIPIAFGSAPSITAANIVNTATALKNLGTIQKGYYVDVVTLTNTNGTNTANIKLQTRIQGQTARSDLTSAITLTAGQSVTLFRSNLREVQFGNDPVDILIDTAGGVGFNGCTISITITPKKTFREYHEEILIPGESTLNVNNVNTNNFKLGEIPENCYLKSATVSNSTASPVTFRIWNRFTNIISTVTVAGNASNQTLTINDFGINKPAYTGIELLIQNNTTAAADLSGANLSFTFNFGVRAYIRKRNINEIFPQPNNASVYLIKTKDGDSWGSVSLKCELFRGKVVTKRPIISGNRFINYATNTALGYGAITIISGKRTSGSPVAQSRLLGIDIVNNVFRDNVYTGTSPMSGSNFMNNIFIDSNSARDVNISENEFYNTAGRTIATFCDALFQFIDARKNWRIRNNRFILTKKATANSRKYDFADESRMGLHNIVIEGNLFLENSNQRKDQNNYDSFGFNDQTITTGEGYHSNISLFNSSNAVVRNNKFEYCKTPIDFGYSFPYGNECNHLSLTGNEFIDCWQLGDLDGHVNAIYERNRFIRLQRTDSLTGYGDVNNRIWINNYFEDCGLETAAPPDVKTLFKIIRPGVVCMGNTIFNSKPGLLDYVFFEENVTLTPDTVPTGTTPKTIIKDNVITGVEPNLRTFALSASHTNIIVGNIGVKGNASECIVGTSNAIIAPVPLVGISRNNYDYNGNPIDDIQIMTNRRLFLDDSKQVWLTYDGANVKVTKNNGTNFTNLI